MPLKLLLESGIASYNVVLKRLLKSTHAAILLQYLAFWLRVAMQNGNNWLYKDWKEIEAHTGLTKSEQETAQKKLLELHIISKKVKQVPKKIGNQFKMVPTTHFQINFDVLNSKLQGFPDNEKTKNDGFPMKQKTRISDGSEKPESPEIGKPDLSVNFNNTSLPKRPAKLNKVDFIRKLREAYRPDPANDYYPTLVVYDGKEIGISLSGLLYVKRTAENLPKNEALEIYIKLYRQYMADKFHLPRDMQLKETYAAVKS